MMGEIGYMIASQFWGRGITTNAVAHLLEKLRDHGGKTATAGAFFDNPASMRVLEKNGFMRVGQEMHFSQARGEEASCALFSRVL